MRRFLIWSSTVVLVLVAGAVLLLAFPPERWIADRAERIVRDTSGYSLEIGELDLDLLSLTPSATVLDATLAGDELEGLLDAGRLVAAVDLPALLEGRMLIDRVALSGIDVALRRDAGGRTSWAAADVEPTEPAKPSGEPIAIPAIRTLEIDDVTVRLDDGVTGRTAELAFEGTGSTLPGSPPLALDATGAIDEVPATAALRVSPLGDVLETDAGLDVSLEASLGDIDLTTAGRVGDPAALEDIELDVTLDAANLDALAALLRAELPAFETLELEGTVLRETGSSELVLRRFDLATAGSTLQGDVRVDPATTPPTLHANLISDRLDADVLQVVLFGEDVAEEDGEGDAAAEGGEAIAPDARVLPDAPLPIAVLFGAVQGAVELRLADIASESIPLGSLDLRAELGTDSATVSIVEASFADGGVTGSLALERAGPPAGASADDPEGGSTDASADVPASVSADGAADAGEGELADAVEGALDAVPLDPTPLSATLELELARLDVSRLLRAADLPDGTGGRLGGKVKYWSEGTSVASLAAGLDGGTFLLMDGGELAAILIELAGLDLFQSLGDALVPGEDPVPIRCAYADIHSDGGLTTINELVIDTEDTVFLADGSIDLATERLDVALEPHPKDASLIASSTPVEIRGTFANPEIRVGAELPVRAAAVAALAALATPALALLPLIEIGDGESSPYCSGLEGALQ